METKAEILMHRLHRVAMEMQECKGMLKVYDEVMDAFTDGKTMDQVEEQFVKSHLPIRSVGDTYIRIGSLFRRQADIIDELRELQKE